MEEEQPWRKRFLGSKQTQVWLTVSMGPWLPRLRAGVTCSTHCPLHDRLAFADFLRNTEIVIVTQEGLRHFHSQGHNTKTVFSPN